jgi:hypothetical protein
VAKQTELDLEALVGMYFMELRVAPNALRGLFEAYCFIVCALLRAVFIYAPTH